MNINATLLGQMITFAILVIVTMKYIWPPITKALENRRRQIAEGLESAERGKRELELARHKITEQFRDAKVQAANIIDQANQRGSRIIEEAKESARQEGNRLLALARTEIEQEFQMAKQKLLKQVASIAVSGAEKILEESIDEKTNERLVEQLITEI